MTDSQLSLEGKQYDLVAIVKDTISMPPYLGCGKVISCDEAWATDKEPS